jgi:glutamyl-tRNA synthetase
VVDVSEASIATDLEWLGITFDEGPTQGGAHAPYRQSERTSIYQCVLDQLAARGETFLCDFSRADSARAASAPHDGEEGPAYPGTCRSLGMEPRVFKRPPTVRLIMREDDVVRYRDGVGGNVETSAAVVGDFVLKRGDGVFSYQLACAVDDVMMGVSEAIRGADLLTSAVRQARLAELLGGEPPVFTHVPLLVGDAGARLAKRDGGGTVQEHRERGVDPHALIRSIAAAYGHSLRPSVDPIDALADVLDRNRFPREKVTITEVLRATSSGKLAS